MTEKTMPIEIAKALVVAQAAMRRVGNDSENAHHRYKYTSAEALLDAAREPMTAAGLGIVQLGWFPTFEPYRLNVRYLLVHSSGETWEMPLVSIPVLPEKGRPEDKAEATALTYSFGYTLRGLLRIPRFGADDDVDQRDDRAKEPSADAIRNAVNDIIAWFDNADNATEIANARARARTVWGRLDDDQRAVLTAAASRAKLRIAPPPEVTTAATAEPEPEPAVPAEETT